jgi:diacylglycerol kinase (ATP)
MLRGMVKETGIRVGKLERRQAAGEVRERSKTEGETALQHVIKASGYSFEGLGATLKHELAFRIEVAAFVLLLPLVVLLPVGLMFKGLLIGAMLLVLMVELLNSALEWVVDYISLEKHPYAKRAKDMGSAAVMLSLINAGTFWLLAVLEWLTGGV